MGLRVSRCCKAAVGGALGAVLGGPVALAAGLVAGVTDRLPGPLDRVERTLCEGAGSLLGVVVAGGALVLFGPRAAAVSYVVATSVGNAVVRQRPLSTAERALADSVFAGTLPPYERIVLTNLVGPGNRPFCLPGPTGQILVNVGRRFDAPLGPMLLHELTHAWQLHRSRFVPAVVGKGVKEQLQHTVLGRDVYDPQTPERSWRDCTNEQQATIVERWYRGGHSTTDPYYPHILQLTGGVAPSIAVDAGNGCSGRP